MQITPHIVISLLFVSATLGAMQLSFSSSKEVFGRLLNMTVILISGTLLLVALNGSYFAWLFFLIYIGAIVVLFIYVVMMLDMTTILKNVSDLNDELKVLRIFFGIIFFVPLLAFFGLLDYPLNFIWGSFNEMDINMYLNVISMPFNILESLIYQYDTGMHYYLMQDPLYNVLFKNGNQIFLNNANIIDFIKTLDDSQQLNAFEFFFNTILAENTAYSGEIFLYYLSMYPDFLANGLSLSDYLSFLFQTNTALLNNIQEPNESISFITKYIYLKKYFINCYLLIIKELEAAFLTFTLILYRFGITENVDIVHAFCTQLDILDKIFEILLNDNSYNLYTFFIELSQFVNKLNSNDENNFIVKTLDNLYTTTEYLYNMDILVNKFPYKIYTATPQYVRDLSICADTSNFYYHLVDNLRNYKLFQNYTNNVLFSPENHLDIMQFINNYFISYNNDKLCNKVYNYYFAALELDEFLEAYKIYLDGLDYLKCVYITDMYNFALNNFTSTYSSVISSHLTLLNSLYSDKNIISNFYIESLQTYEDIRIVYLNTLLSVFLNIGKESYFTLCLEIMPLSNYIDVVNKLQGNFYSDYNIFSSIFLSPIHIFSFAFFNYYGLLLLLMGFLLLICMVGTIIISLNLKGLISNQNMEEQLIRNMLFIKK